MTSDPDKPDATGVVDLALYIAKKRTTTCKHPSVEVDDTIMSLSCASCGAEIDPWWFLRQLAADELGARARNQKRVDDFNAWVDRARATETRLRGEIAATKNRLWNEQINGRPLGTQVVKRRRRNLATGKTP